MNKITLALVILASLNYVLRDNMTSVVIFIVSLTAFIVITMRPAKKDNALVELNDKVNALMFKSGMTGKR